MTNFAILTDSCSDLTAPLRERFGVDGYVPGALVYPDGAIIMRILTGRI